MVGDLEVLVARKIEEFRQAVSGGVGQRFGVNQILALVLQFDVGAHRVNLQTDACFLKCGGLLVEALRQRDASIGGVTRGEGAKNEQILVNHGGDHIFASGQFVGTRPTGSFPADLVAADQREIEDGLRKGRPGLDDLIRPGVLVVRSALDTLNVVLIE